MNNINIDSTPINVLAEAFNWIEKTFICFSTKTNENKMPIFGFFASKNDFKAGQGIYRHDDKSAIKKIAIKNGSLCLKEKCSSHKYVDGKSVKITDSHMDILVDELYFVHGEGQAKIKPWIYFGISKKHFNKAMIDFIQNDEDVTIEKVKNLIKIRKIRGGIWIDGGMVEFSGSKPGNNKLDSIKMKMRIGNKKIRQIEKLTKKFDELMDKYVYVELVNYIKLIKSSI